MAEHIYPKKRVGVIFGGRSGEHEVSLASAKSVMNNLDPQRYTIVPIGITPQGGWLLGATPAQLETSTSSEKPGQTNTSVTLTGDPSLKRLIPLGQSEALEDNGALDVIFPVLHGTYGEDGTLQGLLEMANIPYVGCGVLGAAIGMDKEKMKTVFKAVGLPQADYLAVRRKQWERDPGQVMDSVEQELGFPVFVKPANLGSSVGISKARDRAQLREAIATAALYDSKIVIEKGIDCRELEVAVLGNDEPLASVVGEIVASNEFYDYNAKYVDNQSLTQIPADISEETASRIRGYAIQAFEALDLQGLARVDFFLERNTGQIYINEVNTMPGFTEISMYTKLWNASGLSTPNLLDRLIELAFERYDDRQRNRTTR